MSTPAFFQTGKERRRKIASEKSLDRNGSGNRRKSRMKKGNTIQQFLQSALEVQRKDFSELRFARVEKLMYIKEDLIISHHHSFYDFIVTKARGKSGPLFSFDVHDDIRLVNDATIEKDEYHAGKVVLRSWFEKNKHIFPASRRGPYDPEKNGTNTGSDEAVLPCGFQNLLQFIFSSRRYHMHYH
ncbi:protein FAM50A-like [Silurus meridionalis]|uniref:protein FAM50A-like n=1 Tax=Silurus meridionalis TaxID=175797 RepID=UPI001EEBD97B|nr:protein FAM50A-like [Silurus meridionalis]